MVEVWARIGHDGLHDEDSVGSALLRLGQRCCGWVCNTDGDPS